MGLNAGMRMRRKRAEKQGAARPGDVCCWLMCREAKHQNASGWR